MICDALLLMGDCAFLNLDGVARFLYRRGALLLLASAALLLVRGDSVILCVALLAGSVVALLAGSVAALSRGQQGPGQAKSRQQDRGRVHL